jgi:hypothetical protein
MRTRFYELIQESSSDTAFPTATVNAWLNIALERMGMETLYYEKSLSLSTISGTRSVALPADFIVTKDVYFTDTSGTVQELAPVRYPMIQQDYTQIGSPEFYAIRNATLYFDPIPNRTASSITGFYIATEVALANDGDTPAMPGEFHSYIVHCAVYLSLLSDGQNQLAMPHLQEYLDGTRRLAYRFYDDRVRRNFNMFVGWATLGVGAGPQGEGQISRRMTQREAVQPE